MIPANIIIDTIKKMRGEEEFRIELPVEECKFSKFLIWFLFCFSLIFLFALIAFMVYAYNHRYTGF